MSSIQDRIDETDPLETYLAYQQSPPRHGTALRPDEPVTSAYRGAEAGIHARIAATVEAVRPDLVQLARDLHADPEIGFQEHRSVARIATLLRSHGVEVEVGAFGLDTAFTASAGEPGSHPHFAIIAEYDALPEIGHACGHNIIAGIAVGAFLAVRSIVEETGGRVSIIGTPAEEGGAGKELIIRAGGFDDVDAAGMVHPGVGDLATPVSGGRTTGVRRIGVVYRGRAAHAALGAYLGLNALDAVVTAYQSVAQLRQHILPIDRVHGIILDGGSAANVVPERTEALFLVRSSEIPTLNALTDRIVAALEGAALSTGTTAEITVDVEPPYLPVEQNVELATRWALGLATRGRVVPAAPAAPTLGGPSTDMGNVSQFIPAIHPALGLGGSPDVVPHTAPYADSTIEAPAFEALVDAAIGLARTAADYLADEDLRAAVAREFADRGGRVRWVDPR